MSNAENTEGTVYTHCEVIDENGHKVGIVSDVVSDAATLEPRWLVVDVGVLHTGHYVPVTAMYRTEDGQIVVPFDKEMVKTATKPNKGHVLTHEDERELMEHYGLAS